MGATHPSSTKTHLHSTCGYGFSHTFDDVPSSGDFCPDHHPRVEQHNRGYIAKECLDGPFWLQLVDVGIIRLPGLNLLYIECRSCDQRLSLDNAREYIERLHSQAPTSEQWQRVRLGQAQQTRVQWATEDQLSQLTMKLPHHPACTKSYN